MGEGVEPETQRHLVTSRLGASRPLQGLYRLLRCLQGLPEGVDFRRGLSGFGRAGLWPAWALARDFRPGLGGAGCLDGLAVEETVSQVAGGVCRCRGGYSGEGRTLHWSTNAANFR